MKPVRGGDDTEDLSHKQERNKEKTTNIIMTDNINPETGEQMALGRSPRFTYWAALLIFSTITMGASVEQKNADKGNGSNLDNQNWAVACSAITFALSVIVVGMQLHPISSSLIVGTKVEGLIILVLTGFWAATVSIVSDASNGLAVGSGSDGVTVTNGNLYYFSWAGFVSAVMLIVSYLRDIFGLDVADELRSRSARLPQWAALLAAQLVVMGASANVFDQKCAGTQLESDTYCARTTYGIALGCIGTAFALVIVGMKITTSVASFVIETLVSVLLTIMNGFGVALLTSAQGPGKGLGNLYYFSWISLLVSFMLIASCFETYKNGGDNVANHSPGQAQNDKSNDVQVEELDQI